MSAPGDTDAVADGDLIGALLLRRWQHDTACGPACDGACIDAAHSALAQRLAALRRERDGALAVIERTQELFVKDVRIDSGLRLQLSSEVWPLIAKATLAYFIDSGATNYVEMQYRVPDEADLFTVTVQRWSKPTPHMLRESAETELAALRQQVADAEGLREALRQIAIAPCITELLGDDTLEGCWCPGCRARAALASAPTPTRARQQQPGGPGI